MDIVSLNTRSPWVGEKTPVISSRLEGMHMGVVA